MNKDACSLKSIIMANKNCQNFIQKILNQFKIYLILLRNYIALQKGKINISRANKDENNNNNIYVYQFIC